MSLKTPVAPAEARPGWFETPEAARAGAAAAPSGTVTYLDAINAALDDVLAGDERTLLLGQDIGVMGGAFRVTRGLYEKYGEARVVDTPLAEAALVGMAIGLAVRGRRPIVELQFSDFISCAYDQLVTEAAKLHYRFRIPVPLVVRAPSGAGVGAGPFHSQSPEGVFAHIPGLKIACPGTVQDAYTLLRAAVDDPDPVLYFEHKALYRSLRGPLDRAAPPASPFGAAVRRSGADVTLAAYGGCVRTCLAAADRLAERGRAAEVVDLRWLVPLDVETVARSVERTGRVVIVHEDTTSYGPGAELAARLAAERSFFSLDAPIMRVAAPDTPVRAYVPQVEDVVEVAERCLRI
jgi:2-oxoisovalerate dehydrogenase E1 component beta subunit